MSTPILFATKKMAFDYAKSMFEDYELEDTSVDTMECDKDDSMNEFAGVSGECPAVRVIDGNHEKLAVLAWWEEGGDYQITLDGKVVDNAEFWAQAQQKMRDLVEKLRDDADDDNLNPEVWCEMPEEEERVRWDQI